MKILIMAATTFIVSGCATKSYVIHVDSITTEGKSPYSARVVCLNQGSDLLNAEYERYMKTALRDNGYRIVDDLNEDAEITIGFSFSLKQKEETESKPTFQWVPPSSYSYNSNFQTYGGASGSARGTITENGIGHLQQTGTEVYSVTRNDFILYVFAFKASELEKLKKEKIERVKNIWETTVGHRSEISDARRLFPYIVHASADTFGSQTGGMKSFRVDFHQKSFQDFIERAYSATQQRGTAATP